MKKISIQAGAALILTLILFLGSSLIRQVGLATMCSYIGYYGFPLSWFSYGCTTDQHQLCEQQTAHCNFQPKFIPLLADVAIYLTISIIIVIIFVSIRQLLSKHKQSK